MSEIPRTIRFTVDDKLNYLEFNTKLSRDEIKAQREAADRITSNADLNAARELAGIKEENQKQIGATFEAAEKIASSMAQSTDRNNLNRDRNTQMIVGKLDQIYTGIEDLKSLFDWKLSEMIWILEQQGEHFKQIIEILQRPLTTQARELRNRAEYAYINMLIPEAIMDFEESIKLNPYDFACYLSLGNIYLFHKNDAHKALEYYDLSVRYSIPQSKYYTAFAYIHAGLANYILENYLEAYNATSNAIKSYPNFSQAYYQHAQYCSKLGRYPEAISNLKNAFNFDRGYCTKALSEEDFVPMSSQLKNLVEIVTEDMSDKAASEIEKAKKLIDTFESIDKSCSDGILDSAREKLNEGINLKNERKYFSCRDAVYKAIVSQKMTLDSVKTFLSDRELKLKNDEDKIGAEFIRSTKLIKSSIRGSDKIFPGDTIPTVSHFVAYYFGATVALLVFPVIILLIDRDAGMLFIYFIIISYLFAAIPLSLSVRKIMKYSSTNAYLQDQLNNIGNERAKISQTRELVTSEMLSEMLIKNLDKIDLGVLEFEKYLRKNYG